MHGLIFVTWEKFLSERFKGPIISQYRAALEGKVPPALLMSRVYNDDLLLAAVGAASEASKVSVDKLLKDYG
ncbi:MAG TPA: hypothetical protein VFQ30_01930, partial [Ktedonobacteraceae bacterium]|nr:hypothetical protein [Ktedonobacteraceae bacterium]